MWRCGRSTKICRTAKTMCIFVANTEWDKANETGEGTKTFPPRIQLCDGTNLLWFMIGGHCTPTPETGVDASILSAASIRTLTLTSEQSSSLKWFREAWCVIFLASAVHRHTARVHHQHIYLNGVPINMIVKNCVHCEAHPKSERHTHPHTNPKTLCSSNKIKWQQKKKE